MTQYLLSVYGDEAEITRLQKDEPELVEKMYADTGAFNERLRAEGAWVFAGGLHLTSTATVVRSVNGETLTTDGPFIEAKEVLGGFWIIEAGDLDAALAWAKDGSRACGAPVEVRPFQG